MLMWRIIFLVLAVAVLPACSSKDDDKPKVAVEKPVEPLYNEAKTALDTGEYKQAANLFDEVERQHPYSQWATQAKLMSAYAHYSALRYPEAILALDRFIEMHPGHPDVAYAYYLKALCFYEQISDIGRDQDYTSDALSALDEVVRRFPDSAYAKDAALKRDLTRDHLAGKEMEVGRFYQKRLFYQAALGRYQRVVSDFQTTTQTPEALHRLVECYLALGLTDEAQKSAAVLGYNYPGSEWYEASYDLIKKGKLPAIVESQDPKKAPTTKVGKLLDKVF